MLTGAAPKERLIVIIMALSHLSLFRESQRPGENDEAKTTAEHSVMVGCWKENGNWYYG